MESFHVLCEMRNCITQEGGGVSEALRNKIAAMGSVARPGSLAREHGGQRAADSDCGAHLHCVRGHQAARPRDQRCPVAGTNVGRVGAHRSRGLGLNHLEGEELQQLAAVADRLRPAELRAGQHLRGGPRSGRSTPRGLHHREVELKEHRCSVPVELLRPKAGPGFEPGSPCFCGSPRSRTGRASTPTS